MRAFEYVAGQPWAMTREYLELIAQITIEERSVEDIAKGVDLAREKREEREHSPAAVAARVGARIENTRRATLREGGIAILPITGPIFRYANLFTAYSGATSTQLLATDFQSLMENQDVRAVLLSIDSPGGEAFGIGELATMIKLGARQKPVVAYVSGMGASAAYWLASAADEIVADSTAILGSVGVVLTVRDTKRAEKQRGIDRYEIVSSQSPRKRLEPDSDEGRQALQETADAMAEVFIESVARNRGVSVETVLANFGQGGVMVGKRSVDAGLADSIGSFESLLTDMAGGKRRKRRPMPIAGQSMPPETGAHSGGKKMTFRERLMAFLEKEPDAEEKAPAQTLIIKTEPAQSATVAPATEQSAAAQQQQAPAAESEEMKRLKAENAKLRKDKIEQAATAFVKEQIVAGKVMPAEKESLVAQYVQASLDDEASPLGEGKSRVAMLEATVTKRQKGKHTFEFVPGAVPKGAQVLEDSDDPVAADNAQLDEQARKFAERANGRKKAG